MRVIARLASMITALLGIAVGTYVLYGPTYTRCYFGQIGQTGIGQPVVTLEPAHCDTLSLIASQPVWPMPLLAIAFWSLVPLLAVVGAWQRRPLLILVSLLLELTSIISFGVGPYYVFFVVVPLGLTWILASVAERRRS